jgi:hypothetical protein
MISFGELLPPASPAGTARHNRNKASTGHGLDINVIQGPEEVCWF